MPSVLIRLHAIATGAVMISSDTKVQIDILMKKYEMLRQEVLFQLKESKLPAKYLQIFVAGSLVVIYSLIFNVHEKELAEVLPGLTNRDLLIPFLIAMNVTSYYFVYDILDSYFCIFLAGGRLADIEEQINGKVGTHILIWDSQIQKHPVNRSGKSRIAVSIVQTLIILTFSVALPVLVYGYLWYHTSEQRILLIIASIISVVLFGVFIYVCIDVLFTKRDESYRAIQQIHLDNERLDDERRRLDNSE